MTNHIQCPRCKGSGFVFAYTKIGNSFTPSQGEEFKCPLCDGMGDIEKAGTASQEEI